MIKRIQRIRLPLKKKIKKERKALSSLDAKIIFLQHSTKTLFPFMAKHHDKLRLKYAWYYIWHTKPYATKTHWAVFSFQTFSVSIVIAAMVFSTLTAFQDRANAATYTKLWTSKSDFETNTTISQLDTTTTAGKVQLAANPSPTVTFSQAMPSMVMSPQRVAVDSQGNRYMSDLTANRIIVKDSNGVVVRTFGSYGTGDVQFNGPYGIAVDSNGYIYVADYNNHRIQIFNNNGTLRGWIGKDNSGGSGWHNPGSGKVGAFGIEDGQFYNPYDVAVDAGGNIYVVDKGNYRIQVFSSVGSFIRKIGGIMEDSKFQAPSGVATDANGYIYVADSGNNRIEIFNSDGSLRGWIGKDNTGGTGWHNPGSGKIGVSGTGDGALSGPNDVAVDSNGYIYVSDRTNNRIQIFNSDGTLRGWIGKDNSGGSGWHNPGSGKTGSGVITDDGFNWPGGVAVGSNGYIYVADNGNNRIMVLNSDGTLRGWVGKDNTSGTGWHNPGSGKTGASGNGDGAFNNPSGVAIDSNSYIYVSDTTNHRVQVFNSDGTLRGWVGKDNTSGTGWHNPGSGKTGAQGNGDGALYNPNKLTISAAGYIYVADAFNRRIQVFNSDGSMRGWMGGDNVGTSGWHDVGSGKTPSSNSNNMVGNLQFNTPAGVAVDASGKLFVADSSNYRLQVFSNTYAFDFKVSGNNSDGQFDTPQGVFVDSNNYIYVADYFNHRIQVFNSDGSLRGWIGYDNTGGSGWHNPGSGKWPSPGFTGESVIYLPQDLFVDSNGYIYIAENNVFSLKILNSDGSLRGWIGYDNTGGSGWHNPGSGKTPAQGSGNGQFGSPTGVAVGSSGTIYVADYGNKRVQMFDGSGTYLSGDAGKVGDGEFSNPTNVAIDSSGNIYVVEQGNNRVQVFNPDMTLRGWIGKDNTGGTGWHNPGSGKTGASGNGDGEFNAPVGVTIGLNGYIYVTDMTNNRIQVFNSDGTLRGWIGKDNTGGTGWHNPGSGKTGASGTGDGEFNAAVGVTLDNNGYIYVSDWNNNRIQVFNSDGTLRGWIGKDNSGGTGWHNPGSGKTGVAGSGDGQLNNPRGIVVDNSGIIYCISTSANRMDVFNSNGSYRGWVGGDTNGGVGWHNPGSGMTPTASTGNGQFNYPLGIAVSNATATIYVAEGSSGSNRLQIFNGFAPYYASGTASGTGLGVDAGGSAVWSSVSWNQSSAPAYTAVKFKARTSTDNSTWSAWSDYLTDSSAPYSVPLSLPDSQYLQLELTMTGGVNTPVLDDFTVTYVINAAPTVSAVSASQSTDSASFGKVNLSYHVADGDNDTGDVSYFYGTGITLNGDINDSVTTLTVSNTNNVPTSGEVVIDNEYMTYTGKTATTLTGVTRHYLGTTAAAHTNTTPVWFKCTTTTGEGSKSTGSGADYTGTWDVKTDLPNIYLTGVNLKVTAHDGQLVYMVGGASTGTPFTIDTKPPVLGTIGSDTGIQISSGADWIDQTTINLGLSATDDSTLSMNIQNTASYPGNGFEAYSASKSGWSLSAGSGVKTVYARFRDLYGNTTDGQDSIVYNLTPGVQGVIGAQKTDGSKVAQIIYQMRDSDTAGNSVHPNQLTVAFQYSTDNGSTWHDCTTTTGMGVQSVTSSYAPYTGTWNMATDLPNIYSTTAKVKVLLDDNEPSHNTTELVSDAFTIDTKNPASPTFVINGGSETVGTVNLANIGATDDSTLLMMFSKTPDFSDGSSWENISQTKTFNAETKETIYLKFKDAYGNTSDAISRLVPPTVSNVVISDLSYQVSGDFRLALGWSALKDEPDINGYQIFRKVDKGEFGHIATLSGKETNLYGDPNVVTGHIYTYYIFATDEHGDIGIASNSVSGSPAAVPELSDVKVSNITTNGATITWATDISSDSYVEFGTGSRYGASQGANDMTTSHSLVLSGLNPDTAFHFRARSRDSKGALGVSLDYTFRTLALPPTPVDETAALAQIKNVKLSDVTFDSAIITWETSVITTSTVQYGVNESYGEVLTDQSPNNYTTQHTIKLFSLTQGTTYHYRVVSEDMLGNKYASDDYLFQTRSLPIISETTVKEITPYGAKVIWKTNTETGSLVMYGAKETELTQVQGNDDEKITSHAVTMNNLTPATQYHLKVKSSDAYGNAATSELLSFSTTIDVTPPRITNLKSETSIITDANGESKAQAIISWSTDEPGTSQVKYSLGVASSQAGYQYSTTEEQSLSTSHVVVINNLLPSATYHLMVVSKDASGNIGVSDDYTVLTLKQETTLLQYIVQILEQRFFWVKNLGIGI